MRICVPSSHFFITRLCFFQSFVACLLYRQLHDLLDYFSHSCGNRRVSAVRLHVTQFKWGDKTMRRAYTYVTCTRVAGESAKEGSRGLQLLQRTQYSYRNFALFHFFSLSLSLDVKQLPVQQQQQQQQQQKESTYFLMFCSSLSPRICVCAPIRLSHTLANICARSLRMTTLCTWAYTCTRPPCTIDRNDWGITARGGGQSYLHPRKTPRQRRSGSSPIRQTSPCAKRPLIKLKAHSGHQSGKSATSSS